MTAWLVPAGIVLGTVAAMEVFAAVVHRYVMHGRWGWLLHRDHHEAHDGLFEKNDLYAVLFSLLVIAALFWGGSHWPALFWIGVGASLYGLLYFIVHDGLVHQRWPFRHVPRRGYLKRLYQAHLMHHAVEGREGSVSFGFLYAPPLPRLKARLARRRSGQAASPGGRDHNSPRGGA
jgi:beta-carotene 3-hydroxylase